MLEIRGRPVWEYLLERMLSAGADEVRVVARPEKTDLIAAAEARGARVVLARPPTVARSVAAGLAGLAADDVALVGFPDTIWSPHDGFTRLVAILARDPVDVALGLFRTPELSRSDVVLCDGDGFVRSVAIKPDVPPAELIWGCAAVRVRALSGLAEVQEPGELFDRLAQSGTVRGLELSDDWIDIGTRAALRAARGSRQVEDEHKPR
jgi:glucose-1-phosphate thymidylyltransferase